MCNYAFEMDGCLKDQATYYIDSYDEITSAISKQGNTIMQKLTQETNLTMQAPLAEQFIITSTVKEYFNSNMVTIIIFLAILSTMLIYSLML